MLWMRLLSGRLSVGRKSAYRPKERTSYCRVENDLASADEKVLTYKEKVLDVYTIFEDHKLPVADWVEFMVQAFGFESLAVMTREDRRSGTTTPWWMAKLFLVLGGVQDGVVLSGEVQIDEKMHPLATVKVGRF